VADAVATATAHGRAPDAPRRPQRGGRRVSARVLPVPRGVRPARGHARCRALPPDRGRHRGPGTP